MRTPTPSVPQAASGHSCGRMTNACSGTAWTTRGWVSFATSARIGCLAYLQGSLPGCLLLELSHSSGAVHAHVCSALLLPPTLPAGFIDADEYILLRPDLPSLPALLQHFEQHGGLAVFSKTFGSSGHKTRPAVGTRLGFTKCQPAHPVRFAAACKGACRASLPAAVQACAGCLPPLPRQHGCRMTRAQRNFQRRALPWPAVLLRGSAWHA